MTKGKKTTSLWSADHKENFQSPEVKKDAIAVVEATLSPWQPCWASTATPLLPSPHQWVTGPEALNVSPAGKSANHWELLLGFLPCFTG